MAKLNLSVAVGDYDRNRPLIDGAVQIDGVDPVFMKLVSGGNLLPRVPLRDSTSANFRCRASR